MLIDMWVKFCIRHSHTETFRKSLSTFPLENGRVSQGLTSTAEGHQAGKRGSSSLKREACAVCTGRHEKLTRSRHRSANRRRRGWSESRWGLQARWLTNARLDIEYSHNTPDVAVASCSKVTAHILNSFNHSVYSPAYD